MSNFLNGQRINFLGRKLIILLLCLLWVIIIASCAFAPQNHNPANFQDPPIGWIKVTAPDNRLSYWIPENWRADFPDPKGDVFYPGNFYPEDDISSAFISVDLLEPVENYFSNPMHPIKFVSPKILEKTWVGGFPCIKYEAGINRTEQLCLIGHFDARKYNEDAVLDSFDIALRLFVDTAEETELNSIWTTFVELFIQEQERYLLSEDN